MANKGDIRKSEIQPDFPKKWKVIPFKEGLDKSGKYPKLNSSLYLEIGAYPIIDQGEKLIAGYTDDESHLYDGELPVVIFGDHTRNIKFIDFEFAVGADGTKILKPKEEIDSRFFFYYLKALKIPSFGYSRHYKVFEYLDLPIPPSPEQQRIVAKLDAVFGHLDRVREKLDRIPELLKNFRQQVLAQAVTGELTREWRKSKDLGEWHSTTLDEISELDVGQAFKSEEFEDEGIALLRGQNIEPGRLRWIDTVFQPAAKLEKFKHLFINAGDVILAMDRPIISSGLKVAVAKEEDLPCVLVQRVARFRPLKDLMNGYLYYLISSPFYIFHLFGEQTGTQIPHISSKQILSYEFLLPSKEEQQEIIKRVNTLFEFADKIESQYQNLNAKADQLPPAVLEKAFLGELIDGD